jgi:hypothetical protein
MAKDRSGSRAPRIAVHVTLRHVLFQACIVSLMACQFAHATNSRGYAVDNLILPTSSSQVMAYAIDMDGDNNPENAFGSALAALVSSGSAGTVLDLPASTAAATAAGSIVHLVELRSRDASFASDANAEAIWYVGKATALPPLFDGTDTFVYDNGYTPGVFPAPLSNGTFVSENPVTTTSPVSIQVQVQIGAHALPLSLLAARLKFTVAGNGLTQGQLNGAIPDDDIQNLFFPAVAQAANDVVQADPQSGEAQALLSFFDKDPTDGSISVHEVATNPTFSTLFVPDIQGVYGNAMSFGAGFTAVESVVELPPIFANGFEG